MPRLRLYWSVVPTGRDCHIPCCLVWQQTTARCLVMLSLHCYRLQYTPGTVAYRPHLDLHMHVEIAQAAVV